MKYLLETPVKGSIGREKFKTDIQWRGGVMITDEPEKLGGKDLGPDPYTMLLSSLVSCTLATLKMYIDLKGMEVPEILVEANMSYRLESEGPVMRIERKIDIQNITDPEVQQRLIQIAENCPISKILKGSVKIITAFKDEGSASDENVI